jgi:hypothetical protein
VRGLPIYCADYRCSHSIAIIRRCLTLEEQKELDQLTLLYPEPPRDSELATALKLKLAECAKSG